MHNSSPINGLPVASTSADLQSTDMANGSALSAAAASSSTEPYRDPQLLMRDLIIQQQTLQQQQQQQQSFTVLKWMAAAHHQQQQQEQLMHNRLNVTTPTTNNTIPSNTLPPQSELQLERLWCHLYPGMLRPPVWMLEMYSDDIIMKEKALKEKEKVRLDLQQNHMQQLAEKKFVTSSVDGIPAVSTSTEKLVEQHFNLSLTNSRALTGSNIPSNGNGRGFNSSIASTSSGGSLSGSSSSTRIPQPAHQQLTTREHDQLRQMQLAVPTLATSSFSVPVSASMPMFDRGATNFPTSTTNSYCGGSMSKEMKTEASSCSSALVAMSNGARTIDVHTNSYMTRSIGQIVENTVKLCYAQQSGQRAAAHGSILPIHSTSAVSAVSTPSNSTCLIADFDGSSASTSPTSTRDRPSLLLRDTPSSTAPAPSSVVSSSFESRLPSKKAWLAKHLAESASSSTDSALDMSIADGEESSMIVNSARRGVKRARSWSTDKQDAALLKDVVTTKAVHDSFHGSLVRALTSSSDEKPCDLGGSVRKVVDAAQCEKNDAKRKRCKAVKMEKHSVELNLAPNYDTLTARPLNAKSRDYYERSGEAFVQDGTCLRVAPKQVKCRECRQASQTKGRKGLNPAIYCRFIAFRRLKFNKRGSLLVADFCDVSSADHEDVALWTPHYPIAEPSMEPAVASYIMQHIGDHFNYLLEQETDCKSRLLRYKMSASSTTGKHRQSDSSGGNPRVEAVDKSSAHEVIAWKRAVQGVREMCDVCEAILFNYHWTCCKCGYTVCMQCYARRCDATQSEPPSPHTPKESGLDECIMWGRQAHNHLWQTCTANRQPHDIGKLMLTHIIPDSALRELSRCVEEVRHKLGFVGCNVRKTSYHGRRVEPFSSSLNVMQVLTDFQPTTCQPTVNPFLGNTIANSNNSNAVSSDMASTFSQDPLIMLANVACTTVSSNSSDSIIGSQSLSNSIIDEPPRLTPYHINHHLVRCGQTTTGEVQSELLCPDVPHSWLCDGKLLHLHQARHDRQLQFFQQAWKRGLPVVMSSCQYHFQVDLWTPQSFARDLGSKKVSVINCESGLPLPPISMAQFWKGFMSFKKRVVNEFGRPIPLKLKDWPSPAEDFVNLLPERYRDLTQGLPLPEYTSRNGALNLVSRLSDYFVRPDLGPKMYFAYGMASSSANAEDTIMGTINLQMNPIDTVNVMLHVSVPEDAVELECSAVLKMMEHARCDSRTVERVRHAQQQLISGAGGPDIALPGALWHIFEVCDVEKIRHFLSKVHRGQGGDDNKPADQPDKVVHDDQSFYLSPSLLDRLAMECGVRPYTVVQFHGDAIFIPAGAPHQVHNLHNCIKATQDFVSPENLCFQLCAEQAIHEDKLQIKNILYHAVKDAVAVLCATLSSTAAAVKPNLETLQQCDSFASHT